MAFFILAALLLLFGLYLGFHIGSTIGGRLESRSDYWRANAVALAVAAAVGVVISSFPLLYGAVVGLVGGVIAGLKMEFGESVGPWHAVDRAFDINKGQRDAAQAKTAAARRARKRAGTAAPDVISVPDKAEKDAR